VTKKTAEEEEERKKERRNIAVNSNDGVQESFE
jgi:hypothetical protein